jgi:hypothetical protein
MFTYNASRTGLSDMQSVSIRTARPADAIAVARLAALDSSRSPRGTVLLAEVDGELWAALGVDDGHAISDPFRPSAGVMALLRARVGHVQGEQRRLTALRPRLAA